MPLLTCPLCDRAGGTPITGICDRCATRLSQQLAQIVHNAATCAACLAPERTGSSTGGNYASKPPINLATSDYAQRLGYTRTVTFRDGSLHLEDRNGLAMLHEWERLIRDQRHLTPPALLARAATELAEIRNVCRFLGKHQPWAAAQPWADELAREVSDIHQAGLVALRAIPARRGRIACPGDDPETGDICGATIWLPEDLYDYVTQPGQTHPKRTLYCSNCTTTWTVNRLFAVAKALHGVTKLATYFGRDAVAQVLQVSPRHVNRMISKEQASA